MSYFLGILISYLIGSIPFGYVIAFVKGVDIRKEGSGNIGATNVGRVLGRKYGIIIFILDLLKGFLAVFLIPLIISDVKYPATPDNLVVCLCGLGVVLGHVFPVYIGFKGGKAVATGFGVFLWLAPLPILIVFAVWISVVALTRYVSLGSVICVFAMIGIIMGFNEGPFGSGIFLTALSIMIAIIIIFKHISNIQRIIAGTESRIFGKKNEHPEKETQEQL